MAAPEILIVGAGPTGLVLALWLNRLGVRVRIVDKAAAARDDVARAGRAGADARILPAGRPGRRVVERGLEFAAANLWVRGRKAARAAFGEMGQGLSPFPYMLIFPQDEHELLLIERLAERASGRAGTELLRFEDRDGRVLAHLRRPDGSEEACEAEYLAGCDGAHSTVRENLRIGFPGGTYAHVFYVADVEASGPHDQSRAARGAGRCGLPGGVSHEGSRSAPASSVRSGGRSDDRREALSWEDVSKDVIARLRLTVDRVNWFSTYRVHHRVAEQLPARPRLSARRRGPHPQPRGRAGHEHGHRRRRQSRLEARGGPAAPRRDGLAGHLRARAHRLCPAAGRDDRPGLHGRDQPGRARPLHSRRRRAANAAARLPRSKFFRRFMFRTFSQTAVNYRGSTLERRSRRGRPRRRPAALGPAAPHRMAQPTISAR